MAKREQWRLRSILIPFGWILLTVVTVRAYYYVTCVFSPRDKNYVVIINASGKNLTLPFRLRFTGEVASEVAFGGGKLLRSTAARSPCLVTTQFDNAFFSGAATLADADGTVWILERFRPPARYCGTLVLTVKPDGHLEGSFNRIPLEAFDETNDK
jgi:hypothetical protein